VTSRRLAPDRRDSVSSSVYLGEVASGLPLSITPKEVSYAGKVISSAEITALRWGIFVNVVNGMETSHDFTIEIASETESVHVEWGKRSIFKAARQFIGKQSLGAPIAELSSDDQRVHFVSIVQAVFNNYASGVVHRMAQRLNAGGSYQFGSATITKTGSRFRVGLIFKKDVEFPWSQVLCGTRSGMVVLAGDGQGDPSISCSLRDVRNAVMLPYLTKVMGGQMSE
jgi:hypothetical protein